MTFKRKFSTKIFGCICVLTIILSCLYYISLGQPNSSSSNQTNNNIKIPSKGHNNKNFLNINKHNINVYNNNLKINNNNKKYTSKINNNNNYCYELNIETTNITTSDEYAKFDFQPEWIRTKEFWDRTFEEKYEKQVKDLSRPPLKVIIVPHSHNDPGWLKTFINYFQQDSKQILNLVIGKMQEYKDMTFIWSEISFLQLWWDQAHPTKRRALKKLIQSGRFEITTGGWVMTDEANAHLYCMLDQLIEGHQWIKNHLNITPTTGWSIDPFGHGSTVPYLLAASDFDGTIIQRIHYSWKQWFAKHQSGDFIWKPFWETPHDLKRSLLTHNMPFDIYSIKGSCGPHPFICLNFDFRKIPGEYTEYSIKAQFITDDNIAEKAQLLLEQYSRTASLFPHNVALIPVGDDFRYNKEKEIDQQYTNYKKLIDHINENRKLYHTDISFGTPKDYFKAIKKRMKDFPTLKGDFFVYSDIFSEARPAYWSGYFTTRPFYKLLSTELEHNLRSAELLFTFSYNTAYQMKFNNAIKVLEKNYEKLILARRNLGLFQHHDAITGTSKSAVMRDYGLKLYESIQDSVKMQTSTIEMLMQPNNTFHHDFILSELDRDNYSKLPRKTPIVLNEKNEGSFVIFNSLAQNRVEIITIRTTIPNVMVLNENNEEIKTQINPVWNITDNYENPNIVERVKVSTKQYEILFAAELPAMSLLTYKIKPNKNYFNNVATIYCNDCTDNSTTSQVFDIKNKQLGDIQLENTKMRLLFDEKTGFMKSITRKNLGKSVQCGIKFAAYKSAQFHSGAYLFKTDPEQRDAEKDVLEQYENMKIIIISGDIASDITVLYGPFLAHTIRIFNSHTYLDNAIYIENDIDFELPPKNRETELFMRFVTEIENGEIPEFYSDQNGFQYHKRVKVPGIGIEGNYYPITSGAFIQDAEKRLTLLTNHAQGAASYNPGELEVMLDRRTLYDDYRGMGEGIVDSKLTRHKFWLIMEYLPQTQKDPLKNNKNNIYSVPSYLSNKLANNLRYPPNIYFIENYDVRVPKNLKHNIKLLKHEFPCDLHLLNLRTLTEEQLPLFPSKNSLLILHRQGFDCNIMKNVSICNNNNNNILSDSFDKININSIQSTSLTGLNKMELISDLSEIELNPMDIQTFNVTFTV